MDSLQPQDYYFKLKWTEGINPAHAMRRAVNAVVGRNCVYFRPWGEEKIHVYDVEHKNWYEVPECVYVYSSLAHVSNVLTTIGGEKDCECTDKLLSLTWNNEQQWEETLPHMPTKRKNPISLAVGSWLVVSGGIQAGRYLTLVELLNLDTKLWSSVSNLPEPIFNASISYGSGYIYMLGGNREPGFPTTTVMACNLERLVASKINDNAVWRNLADLPVERSSCACIGGELLAVGGQYHEPHTITTPRSPNGCLHICSSSVYRYIKKTDSWETIGHLATPVSECFTAVLPGNKLMVLGGNTRERKVINKVLFGTVYTEQHFRH